MSNQQNIETIEFHPIGYVRNGITETRTYEQWQEIESEIHIRPDLADGLDGIEEYSHIIVLFYFHLPHSKDPQRLRIHPKDRKDLPLVGIFATRTQFRPNRIGLSTPRLIAREGNVLRVRGLDNFDGTPIIDIKAISPRRDWPQDAVLPEWVDRL